jgi:hypothetical protein
VREVLPLLALRQKREAFIMQSDKMNKNILMEKQKYRKTACITAVKKVE